MPKVYHVKARKDYPESGIRKGEMYYKWSIKTGPASGRSYRSKTRPKPSQLTGSEFMGALYAIEENLGDLSLPTEGSIKDRLESVVSDLESIVSDLEDLRNETQEKLDNMPEGLQQGSTGELLQERIDALESVISDLERVKDNPPEREDQDDDDFLSSIQAWLDDEVKSISSGL